MTELIINGKDAFTEWGVRMGDGFLDTLNGYFPMKEYITNNDRTQDGVQYVGTPKVNERSIVLNFTMEGRDASFPSFSHAQTEKTHYQSSRTRLPRLLRKSPRTWSSSFY